MEGSERKTCLGEEKVLIVWKESKLLYFFEIQGE
jgi:hypothetical protein